MIRTFLTTILGFFTAGTLITEVDWRLAFLTATSATIYVLILCILAGLPEVKPADELLDDEVDEEEEISGYDRVGDEDDME